MSNYLYIIVLMLIYWILTPLQKALASPNYYENYNPIFLLNNKKMLFALIIRFLTIFASAFIGYYLFSLNKPNLIFFLSFAQFCVEIPSIVNYNLYKIFDSKEKFLQFLQCLLSISATTIGTIFFVNLDNPFYYILVFLIIFIVFLGKTITKYLTEKCIVFTVEQATLTKFITQKNLDFEYKHLSKVQRKYFKESSRKHKLNYEFLTTAYFLEKINRFSYAVKLFEILIILISPKFVIKHNITVGECQVSGYYISKYFDKINRQNLLSLLQQKNSIDICAFAYKTIRNDFLEKYLYKHFLLEEDIEKIGGDLEIKVLNNHEKLAAFMASNYLTGKPICRINAVSVYAYFFSMCDLEDGLTDKEINKIKNLKSVVF